MVTPCGRERTSSSSSNPSISGIIMSETIRSGLTLTKKSNACRPFTVEKNLVPLEHKNIIDNISQEIIIFRNENFRHHLIRS